jgi:hypothetical protein
VDRFRASQSLTRSLSDRPSDCIEGTVGGWRAVEYRTKNPIFFRRYTPSVSIADYPMLRH